ncbi:hypothetical protein ARMSODRAFT_971830 [Armillaria solidipes]|uniref:Uncharacterized protein n=1 Tax=Armillaria solidipes TaxID=1076256 RepID=A0A2H3C4X7_9AGAR|nr:hypothetical protein ARMSODRAFT_971830 [Armillaria solidipes]
MTAERSNEESREECDSETSYDDEFSSETSYEVSTDPTSAQSSYVPLDAHILASWRHPNSVVLPFLCVTDEEDIFSLMGGFVGRVVLGWLDKVCPDPEVLPVIRFAYGAETRTDTSLGVYDLTDPVRAVKFAQFILGLRGHVEGIVAQCQTPTFKRLSWRSDSIDDDNSGTEEQWKQRILTLKSAERGRLQGQGSKHKPPLAEPVPRVLPGIGLVQPQKPSLAAVRSKTPSNGASVQSEERGRQESGAKSLAGISLTATLYFSSYAHDRKIISLSNIPLGPDASTKGVDAPTEINEMLKFYEDQTSYMKPLSKRHAFLHLLALNELLIVGNGVEEVRDHFLRQIYSFRGANTPELPQPFWEVILGRLSSLLWALVGRYSKQLAGKPSNEGGARHDWDVLLNFGFMAAHELASGRVVLERAVLLSRNIAAYVMMTSPDSDGAEFKTFVLQMYTIALQQAAYTPDTVSPSVFVPGFILQSRQFVPIAAQQLQDVQHLFRNSKKGRKAILKRASDEPELGIVDAILTVPSERMQLVPEPLIRVAEFRATFQASTRALSADNIVEPEEELAISEECAQTPEHLDFPVQAQNMYESKPAWVDRRRSGRSWSGVSATDGKKEGHWWGTAPLFCRDMLGDQIRTRDVLFAEYKKPTQTYAKALVQAKMYLEASVRYLASLEVTKKAVFALATDGVEGAVLMAWCSGNLEASLPLPKVLLRLREYGDATLKEAVEAALNAEDFKQTSWNKTAQFNRMESG